VFVTELSNRQPTLVQDKIASLLSHMDGESSVHTDPCCELCCEFLK